MTKYEDGNIVVFEVHIILKIQKVSMVEQQLITKEKGCIKIVCTIYILMSLGASVVVK